MAKAMTPVRKPPSVLYVVWQEHAVPWANETRAEAKEMCTIVGDRIYEYVPAPKKAKKAKKKPAKAKKAGRT